MTHIHRVSAFRDNYIWIVEDLNSSAFVVDPGEASPVIDFLQKRHLILKGILVTHHHYDHTGGIDGLLKHQSVPVYGGYQEPIPQLSHPLHNNDNLSLEGNRIQFQILEIPGHTLGHIAYFLNNHEGNHENNQKLVFCGDTLFTGGCGRVFEGTATQMLNSLSKLKNLPLDTYIYCGHEYTLENLQFSTLVEPHNKTISHRLHETQILRNQDKATVPNLLHIELETNPFLRTHIPEVIQAAERVAHRSLTSETEVFEVLRNWKNNWKPN